MRFDKIGVPGDQVDDIAGMKVTLEKLSTRLANLRNELENACGATATSHYDVGYAAGCAKGYGDGFTAALAHAEDAIKKIFDNAEPSG